MTYLPEQLIHDLGTFTSKQISDCAKYENREPFDDSFLYALITVAAQMYEAGLTAGARSEQARHSTQWMLDRERAAGGNT